MLPIEVLHKFIDWLQAKDLNQCPLLYSWCSAVHAAKGCMVQCRSITVHGCKFVSVCENQIQSKLRQFVYNSMEEIDSHNRMFTRIVARIDSMILVEFAGLTVLCNLCWLCTQNVGIARSKPLLIFSAFTQPSTSLTRFLYDHAQEG